MVNTVIAVSDCSSDHAPSNAMAAGKETRAERYRLAHVADEALHARVKALAGHHNVLTADLLAHLAEVEARGIHRERACSSLYTYCVYELRFSEDEAQRRARAARAAREFPVLFEMLASGAIHLTGVLLLAPYLTADNHAGLLARARFRTKREIERLIAEVAPRPDVPARVEPLGPLSRAGGSSWQSFVASLRGPVRDFETGVRWGEAPPSVLDAELPGGSEVPGATDLRGATELPGAKELPRVANEGAGGGGRDSSVPARIDAQGAPVAAMPVPLRYRVEFTASETYVGLLEEARDLLQHQVPNRDIARVHEMAMAAFVEMLRKRRHGARSAPARIEATVGSAPSSGVAASGGSAPARIKRRRGPVGGRASDDAESQSERIETAPTRHVPAAVRRAVWQRDGARCTFREAGGRRCEERAGLEMHHEQAFALGGTATVENLRLVCRAHNALFAERDFGREVVERKRKRYAEE